MPGHQRRPVRLPEGKSNALLILLFTSLSLLLLANHEPWRDEAQAWLIARDSPDSAAMLRNIGYEGTPALWHLLLYAFVKLGLPYSSMAAANFLSMLAAAVLFVNYAPFTRLQKGMFILGYYVIYEYSAIARSYGLSVLLLFLIAWKYGERFKRTAMYPALVALLANTNPHSLAIASVLGVLYLFELGSHGKKGIAPLLILLAGLLAAVSQLAPPPDLMPEYAGWNLELEAMPRAATGAFLPIPRLEPHFWEDPRPAMWGGLPIFLLTLAFFTRRPNAMAIYLLSTLGLLGIFFLKEPGYSRHHGLIFLMFIFALWISGGVQTKNNKIRVAPSGKRLILHKRIAGALPERSLGLLLYALLSVQILAGAAAAYYELKHPFSAGKDAAEFLKANGYAGKDTLIVAYHSFSSLSIQPYLKGPRPCFYYLEYGECRTFIVWNLEYHYSQDMPEEEVLKRADAAFFNLNYSKELLLLTNGMDAENNKGRYELIAQFNNTIVKEDSLYIYRLKEWAAKQG